MRNAHSILAGKLEQMISFGSWAQKWEENTTEGVELIHITEDRDYYHANVMVPNLLIPQEMHNFFFLSDY
jgi:hypothetical protein